MNPALHQTNKSKSGMLKLFLVVIFSSIVLTLASAAIPTGQAPVATYLETTSITGQTLLALPCEGASGTLHQRHGVPFDLIWYTPCSGTHILAKPLVMDLLFWLAVVSLVTISANYLNRRSK